MGMLHRVERCLVQGVGEVGGTEGVGGKAEAGEEEAEGVIDEASLAVKVIVMHNLIC